MAETKNLLLFRKWDLSNIEVKDPGLKTAISLRKQILPYTYGRSALKRFNKADVNIVERLINKTMHFGKKYAKNTGRMTGKKAKLINTVKTAFEIIELKTGQNPVEVLVRAVENSAVPISNDVLDGLKTNPRVLVDPDAQMSMVSTEMPGDILAVLRNSLSESIGDVFSVCVAVLLISLFITMLLNKKGFPTHSNSGSKLSSR